ncbi:MAG TPA: pilus assembly protein PilM [Vicinamibacterales bacterium]|jgi:Tfp pilus assembly PilM family ATPase|nr:pilus assembly protein PilM [Vicinamibacterales bacterium]
MSDQPVKHRRSGLLASAPPSAALEITRSHVTAVSAVEQRGGTVVSSYSAEPLPPSAVEPGLNAVNVHDAGALTAAIKAALEKLSPRPRRIALVLPDTVGKVSLLRFEKVPAKLQDLDQLIRWQVRKAAPFRIEDAQVSWCHGAPLTGGGREYVVTIARRDIIAGYEAACQAADAHAGLVDLASFNLINAVLASGQTSGDWLLVNVAADYATLAVVRGSDLVFFRNRGSNGPAELADLVHQTAMYHEDRLGGGGFARVIVTGASLRGPEQAAWLRRSIEERLGSRVETLDFRSAATVRDRISVGPELLDALAPSIGILLRERVA